MLKALMLPVVMMSAVKPQSATQLNQIMMIWLYIHVVDETQSEGEKEEENHLR